MKISSVEIRGFKSLRNFEVKVSDMLILIGENNAGKSNILQALDLFFQPRKCTVSSNCFRQIGDEVCTEIEITVSFKDLTDTERTLFSQHIEENSLRIRRIASTELDESGKVVDGTLGSFLSVVQKPNDPLLCLKKKEIDSSVVEALMNEYTLPAYVHGARGEPTGAKIKENWEILRADLAQIKGLSAEFQESTVLGAAGVAQGNLPKFLLLPAVKTASDELKTTQNTLFGEIFKQMIEEEDSFGFASSVKEKLVEIQGELNPERGTGTPSDAISILEAEITELLQDHMPDSTVHLHFLVPTLEKILLSGSFVQINDGFKSTLEHKGHGAQRLFLFSLLRLYANRLVLNSSETERTFIIAIEEPEIYLHPPAQRRLFSILQEISTQRQVLLCTHSPYFINMPEYKDICVISRTSRTNPTDRFQTEVDLFQNHEKDDFKLISQIDPTRSEVFFSKKVILVEGDTERLTIPLIAELMGYSLPKLGITVIESGGKTVIPFFMKIMNTFNITYLVIYDEDTFEEPADITSLTPNERSRLSEQRRIYAFNTEIENTKGDNNYSFMVTGDYEKLLGVSRNQSDRKGKSLAAYRKLQTTDLSEIDSSFIDALRNFIEL